MSDKSWRHDGKAALRVGLSVGVPLFALYAIDRLDLAVFAAFGALASLYGHRETGRSQLQTQAVAGALLVATIAVAAAFSAARGPAWLLGCLLLAAVIGPATLGAAMRWLPRGEMFFVLVLLVIADIPVSWAKVPTAVATGAAAAAFCVLMSRLGQAEHPEVGPGRAGLGDRVSEGWASINRRRHAVAIVASALGVLSAWLIALVLGVGHPFWAPVIVAALMPALEAADVYRRIAHLILGTLGGVSAAALLFSFEPGHLALIVIVVLCQMAAEVFVGRQYGVALVFFSPLAIGMSNLVLGLPWTPLLVDRIAEAFLGSAVAFLVILAGRRILSRVE